MSNADGQNERFGPVLRIIALAATLLALAAVIGPRLASSPGDASQDGAAPASLPNASTAVPNHDVPALPTGNAPDPTGSLAPFPTTTVPAPVTTTPPTTTPLVATTTTTTGVAPAVAPRDGGAVDLALAGVHAGRYGPQRAAFFPGDDIAWHFRVTNTGAEYLWGVYVYLELYGPVACMARRLEVGESTDCWAQAVAFAGDNSAEAWVTAWTEIRMVTDRVSGRVVAIAP